jgi:hypothetical protein
MMIPFTRWRHRVRHLRFLLLRRHQVAVVTTINLTAGGPSDEVVVQSQPTATSPAVNLPVADITWSGITDPAVTVAPAADGIGFDFTAGEAAATESLTAVASYSGPGASAPVTASLAINVTAAVAPVTALQFDEISGT